MIIDVKNLRLGVKTEKCDKAYSLLSKRDFPLGTKKKNDMMQSLRSYTFKAVLMNIERDLFVRNTEIGRAHV